MNLKPTIRRAALVGMGCHALLPALYQAMTTAQVHPQRNILILTLELCTIHLQTNRSIRNIIGSALFGDGASAIIIKGQNEDEAGQNGHGKIEGPVYPKLLGHMSYTDFNRPGDIAFTPSDTGYRINLSTKIPNILREMVPPLIG